MTVASAASLPGHGQEAPFPTYRTFPNYLRRPGAPRLLPAVAPQRHLPRTVLADDPPRGRILVVTDNASLALDAQRILRDAGYRAVGPAASADEAERLTSGRSTDGAVIDSHLANGAAAVIADRLAGGSVPFVWLADTRTDVPPAHGLAPVVGKPLKGEELIRALERAMAWSHRIGANSFYPVPPPQDVWPRVFPQL